MREGEGPRSVFRGPSVVNKLPHSRELFCLWYVLALKKQKHQNSGKSNQTKKHLRFALPLHIFTHTTSMQSKTVCGVLSGR